MASTTRKKSQTKSAKSTASGSRSSKSGSSRSGGSRSASSRNTSSRSRKPAQPQKSPIRREVGSLVLLVLTLCTLVSYVGIDAILVGWLAVLLKGLFGYGYWLAAPAMLLGALILAFHRGRPVRLRLTCALLTPMLFGALGHMLFPIA